MNLVVIGAQWGDEGKGKIVDFLAPEASSIVRYSGGANAGHTIVFSGEQWALHLVPSGVLYPEKKIYLGTAMVIDPEALFAEIAMLNERGINTANRIFISDRAHITLPSYRRIDKERDAQRKRPIGTTGRGIGTSYSMKAERDGIRIADLHDNTEKIAELEDGDKKFIEQYIDKLLEMEINLASVMEKAVFSKENVLFEGAQGAMLDLDAGTYPYVSSGFSSSAGAAIGGAIGPRAIDKVLGVFKAYSTRVGNGPLPTEFDEASQSELYHFVRETGREYGVTTGRPRRCGCLDLPALRYACFVNSIDSLVLTHLDIYDTLDAFEVCVAYEISGKEVTDFPSSAEELERAKPVLKKFSGWKQSLKSCKTYSEIPKAAQEYVEFIEDYTRTPVSIISVGYDRSETLVRTAAWS